MSAFKRSRPTARGVALRSLAFLVGFAFPFVTHASIPAPVTAPAVHSDDVLTLFSEPGLRGRHATYRGASRDVERQGFVARSAASTGMWTLCEGGEVASRCQTVQGEARELKLSPQIVRPGLNALALYDQPGLKGEQVIYSFPADRPAPFHARSARTWGGPWALCGRGYKHCQTLDGSTKNLDLVVAAVRPAPEAAEALPDAEPVKASAPRLTLAAHAGPPRRAPSAHPTLTYMAARHARPPARPAPIRVREVHARPPHAIRAPLYTPVRDRLRAHRAEGVRRLHQAWPVRYQRIQRHPAQARLVQEISDRQGHHAHAARRRLYRRVRVAWRDDPYLYRYDPGPRFWGPPPGW